VPSAPAFGETANDAQNIHSFSGMFCAGGLAKGLDIDMSLEFIAAYDRADEVGMLFSEYKHMLIEHDSSVAAYLDQQHYNRELERLDEKYGMPTGRFYLAALDGKVAGCAGFRPLNEGLCEMKRLYVNPEFRGAQIGQQLVMRLISDAREIGYRHMVLDTFSFLTSAIKLYEKCGFYNIPAYNGNPSPDAVFMQLDLNA